MLCNVTGFLRLPDGQLAENSSVWLTPTRVKAVAGNVVLASGVFLEVGAAGAIDVNLYAGPYLVRVERQGQNTVYEFRIGVPSLAAADWSSLLDAQAPFLSNAIFVDDASEVPAAPQPGVPYVVLA